MLTINFAASSVLQKIYSRFKWRSKVIPIAGLTMNGNVINVLQNIHFPIGVYSVYGILGLELPTVTGSMSSFSIRGRPHRKPRLNNYLNQGFSTTIQNTISLLRNDLSFTAGRCSVPGENATRQDNIEGGIQVNVDGCYRFYPSHYRPNLEPTYAELRYQYTKFRVDAVTLTTTLDKVTSSHAEPAYSIDGIKPSKLIGSESDDRYDWRQNGTFLYLHWNNWDPESNIIDLVYSVGHGTILSGVKEVSISCISIEIVTDQQWPDIQFDTWHSLDDIFTTYGTIYEYTPVFKVSVADDPPTSKEEVIARFNPMQYAQPRKGKDFGNIIEDTVLTCNHAFFERPIAPYATWLDAAEKRSEVLDYLGYNVYWVPGMVTRKWSVMRDSLKHITGACHLTSQDALSSAVDGLKNNYVETFAELSSIFEPLGMPKDFYRKLVRHSSKGGKIITLLKILASANLAVKFALMPNYEAAKELSSQLAPLLRQLSELENDVIGRASTKALAVTTQGVTMDILMTSKVVFKIYDTPLAFALIATDSAQVLPTFERLWAAFPMSFVIDTVHDFSRDLKTAQQALMSLAIYDIVYSVNSVFERSDFTDDDFNAMSAEPVYVGGKYPAVTSFLRWPRNRSIEPLRNMPLYPWLESEKALSWDISGSLVISFI